MGEKLIFNILNKVQDFINNFQVENVLFCHKSQQPFQDKIVRGEKLNIEA
jgi:hypothetical protein